MAQRKTLNLLDDQRIYGYVDRTLKVLVARLEKNLDMHPDHLAKLVEGIDHLAYTVVARENAKTYTDEARYD